MRIQTYFLIVFMAIISLIGITGCGSSDSKDHPASYITLKGTLTAPEKLEPTLINTLANIIDNTDSEVRNAFKEAIIDVNESQMPQFTLTELSATSNWPIKIENVPETQNGNYIINVSVGHITLKTHVNSSETDSFTINLKTTAAAMLAEQTDLNLTQNEILATYSTFVNALANELASASMRTPQELGNASIVNSPSIINFCNEQKSYIKRIIELGISSNSKIAYLQKKNDLDGDGRNDLLITQSTDALRVSFSTSLSDNTLLHDNATGLDDYSDADLLTDYQKESLLSSERTFDRNSKNFILGLFFKKSAVADSYLKLYIHKVEIEEGTFKGIFAEYSFVTATSTALATGTKTIMLTGSNYISGTVYGTDFINDSIDSTDTAEMLSFIDSEKKLGNSSDKQIVYHLPGKGKLSDYGYVLKGSSYYRTDISNALNGRELIVGEVFAAYFEESDHYALFKIIEIRPDRIKVDYIVNTAKSDPIFSKTND